MPKNPIYYEAVDTLAHAQWQVTEFDQEKLKFLSNNGVDFFAVYLDGTQEKIPYYNVIKPQPIEEQAPLISKMSRQMNLMFTSIIQMADSVEVLQSKKQALDSAVLNLKKEFETA